MCRGATGFRSDQPSSRLLLLCSRFMAVSIGFPPHQILIGANSSMISCSAVILGHSLSRLEKMECQAKLWPLRCDNPSRLEGLKQHVRIDHFAAECNVYNWLLEVSILR